MPWTTPASRSIDCPTDDEPQTLEQQSGAERQLIRTSIPEGWADHHNRLTYDAPSASGAPVYGVCGHRRVCLLTGGEWRHPYPHARHCDQPPTLSHAGLW